MVRVLTLQTSVYQHKDDHLKEEAAVQEPVPFWYLVSSPNPRCFTGEVEREKTNYHVIRHQHRTTVRRLIYITFYLLRSV